MTGSRGGRETGRSSRGPDLTAGMALLGAGGAAFASVVVLLPPSRVRTLVALLLPGTALLAFAIWWLKERLRSGRAKALGCGLALVGAACLGASSSVPTAVIAVLWGLPASMALTFSVFALVRFRTPPIASLAVGTAFLVSLTPWLLIKVDGASGQMMPNLVWASHRSSAGVGPGGAAASASLTVPASSPATGRDWPGFRGPSRDGEVPGEMVRDLDLEWVQRPPVERWRRPIGRGWSSFAIVGNLACTQDQAEGLERVVCLDAASGSTVWVHSDETRFDEIAGGPGPRATPQIDGERLYALGGTGILNCLATRTGRLIWSVRLSDGKASTPEWGFASSPLVLGDLVYVSPAGVAGTRMAAFDKHSGEVVWRAPGEHAGYGSPQPALLGGTLQVLLFDGGGLVGYEARTGEALWEYEWPTQLPRAAQPHVAAGDTVIVGMGYGRGAKSLRPIRTDGGWSVQEVWASSRFKPKFNAFVIRDGLIFGLDEGVLACVDADTGERLWKGGRYGHGQVLLLGQTLLVVTESGDLVLVEASPERHHELARSKALSGKTWNHPAIARGRLFVRNGSEAAAYNLISVELPKS